MTDENAKLPVRIASSAFGKLLFFSFLKSYKNGFYSKNSNKKEAVRAGHKPLYKPGVPFTL